MMKYFCPSNISTKLLNKYSTSSASGFYPVAFCILVPTKFQAIFQSFYSFHSFTRPTVAATTKLPQNQRNTCNIIREILVTDSKKYICQNERNVPGSFLQPFTRPTLPPRGARNGNILDPTVVVTT